MILMGQMGDHITSHPFKMNKEIRRFGVFLSTPVQLVLLGLWSKVPAPLVVRHCLRKLHGIRTDKIVGFDFR